MDGAPGIVYTLDWEPPGGAPAPALDPRRSQRRRQALLSAPAKRITNLVPGLLGFLPGPFIDRIAAAGTTNWAGQPPRGEIWGGKRPLSRLAGAVLPALPLAPSLASANGLAGYVTNW
nr:hypothetical protein [Pseudomonas peli]